MLDQVDLEEKNNSGQICLKTVTKGTKNYWPYKTEGRLGQIVLIGNML
jgi:hypothetical protein